MCQQKFQNCPHTKIDHRLVFIINLILRQGAPLLFNDGEYNILVLPLFQQCCLRAAYDDESSVVPPSCQLRMAGGVLGSHLAHLTTKHQKWKADGQPEHGWWSEPWGGLPKLPCYGVPTKMGSIPKPPKRPCRAKAIELSGMLGAQDSYKSWMDPKFWTSLSEQPKRIWDWKSQVGDKPALHLIILDKMDVIAQKREVLRVTQQEAETPSSINY
jgi:hypothetical protein